MLLPKFGTTRELGSESDVCFNGIFERQTMLEIFQAHYDRFTHSLGHSYHRSNVLSISHSIEVPRGELPSILISFRVLAIAN